MSTSGADSGFTDVGTVTADAAPFTRTLAVGKQARWVRVTANQLFDSVGATGTLATPRAIDPTGTYIEQARPYANGALVMSGTIPDARARFVSVGSALTATECNNDTVIATFAGQLNGRTWTATFTGNKDANPTNIRGVINDEGTVIAGIHDGNNGNSVVFMRTSDRPKYCVPRKTGTGSHHILVLDPDPVPEFYPVDAATPLPGYTLEAIGAGMLDASELAGKDAVITRGVCKLADLLAPQQMALLLQWVAAGHKMVLGGGGCNNGADFAWLPYPFTAAGTGPETANASLIQIESDALGTNDKNDAAHFVDVFTYVTKQQNELPAANAMTTTDPHWCGHFFVAKPTNVNGFIQSYAVDGRGLLIYDGFNGDTDVSTLQRIRQLELALPVPAGLPCTESVTEAFILEPSQEATFVAGKARTVRGTMQLLANQGWSGHATLKTTGDLPAKVTPSAFDVAGGTQALDVAVNVPASTKAGVYTVNVIADNGAGKTAQASISLTGTAPLVKQFTQKRIRLYGIHFDVDSAHIQPRSEPVIAEIAQIMRSTPGLRFQVEGHTDSDGGAAYNLGLSQRRAQAVVADLVTRYQVARPRLVAKGFGLTRPVATNATAAGKALNRRVELLRL
ncbi:MAG TPA: OmpA family protein [Candidatus Elarobacter sp.]|nr:OmpA family protein [Candidatus Elarobacter sp.]